MNNEKFESARICAEVNHPKNDNFLNYMRNNSQSTFHSSRLQAAFLTSKLWKPNSTIKIGFMSDGTNTPKTSLNTLGVVSDPLSKFVYDSPPIEGFKKVVLERYAPITNLKFIFVDNPQEADIRVDFDVTKGSWSYLGVDCLDYSYPETTLNLGWIDCPTILHEFGHVLGMFHEHQNTRGKSIKWDKEKVYNWAKTTQGWDKTVTDNNIFNHYDLNLTNGSVYDPLSIMLYFFPAWLTTDNIGTQINNKLSGTDVLWINNMYKKGAPMTAEEFYPKIYGVSLAESLKQSNKMGATEITESVTDMTNENYLYNTTKTVSKNNGSIFIIIICIVILLFIIFYLKN